MKLRKIEREGDQEGGGWRRRDEEEKKEEIKVEEK